VSKRGSSQSKARTKGKRLDNLRDGDSQPTGGGLGGAGRRSPFRIRRWWVKLIFVVVGLAAIEGVTWLLQNPLEALPIILGLVRGLMFVVLVAAGARVFRGPNEDLLTPRAWWRMASGPRMSWIVAAVGLASILGNFAEVAVLFATYGHIRAADKTLSAFAQQVVPFVVVLAVITSFYVVTALRLRGNSRGSRVGSEASALLPQ
jgi:hypothetical protein